MHSLVFVEQCLKTKYKAMGNYEFTTLIKPIITPNGVIYQPILEVNNGSECSYVCLCKTDEDTDYMWYSFSLKEICNPEEVAPYEFLCFPLETAKDLVQKALAEYEACSIDVEPPSASSY